MSTTEKTYENKKDFPDDENEKHYKLDSTETLTEKAPFTIFRNNERVLLIIVLALSGFWSATSSPIYFPALPTVKSYFNIDEGTTNLSVLSYLILGLL